MQSFAGQKKIIIAIFLIVCRLFINFNCLAFLWAIDDDDDDDVIAWLMANKANRWQFKKTNKVFTLKRTINKATNYPQQVYSSLEALIQLFSCTI